MNLCLRLPHHSWDQGENHLFTPFWLLQVSLGNINGAHMDEQKIWRPHETHHPLCNILDPSPIKELISCGSSSGWQVGAFISCRTESQSTFTSSFLSTLILGLVPAGSDSSFNEVSFLSLAISAMNEFVILFVNSDLEAKEPFSCWQRAQVLIHLCLGRHIHSYSCIIFHCLSFFSFCSSASPASAVSMKII